MKVAFGKMLSNKLSELRRPAICVETAHWNIHGRCFFCQRPTIVEHNDTVKVVGEPVIGKKVA